MSDAPLVSVGLPVRNGGALFAAALASVRHQTHAPLEILVADNASDDGTAECARAAAARDARVSYVRHERPLPAVRNFRSVFERARGEYFLLAAHDDLRTPNYVAVLLAALLAQPSACLAFSDLTLYDDPEDAGNLGLLAHDFSNVGLPFAERLRRCAQTAPFHVYGLLRSSALRGYPWYETELAPDWPLMIWLACRGDFIYAPGALFGYYWPARSDAERARAAALRRARPLARERLTWACADAAARATALAGRRHSRWLLALRLSLWQHRGLKNLIYTRSPRLLQRAFEGWKARRGRP